MPGKSNSGSTRVEQRIEQYQAEEAEMKRNDMK